jgi:hypothetical protein
MKKHIATFFAILFSLALSERGTAETLPGESVVQSWKIADGRLTGEIDIRARGEAGDRFLLLRAPAVLTGFSGEGWRVVKGAEGKNGAYYLVAARAGVLVGHAAFQMPLADPRAGWAVPTGPAAVQRIDIRWNEGGWEFDSPMAARVEPLSGLPEGTSGARLILGPAEGVTVSAKPRQRDAANEETRYFVECSNLFVPGPGVVNGRHKVTVRPAQGRVSELTLAVPDGFMVGDVGEGPVGGWSFDPRTHKLRISVEPAQDKAFSLLVETQRGTGALPLELSLAPVRVGGTAGQVGLLALAFGGDAQPEKVTPKSMPVVNLDDFDSALLPRDAKGAPLAVLHKVFRYQGDAGSVGLRVVPVKPEIRMVSRQVVSLGDERMVLAADLTVRITRAGVFRLTLDVPDVLEIESLTGDSLGHWTEAPGKKGRKLVTLHLKGRTIGEQKFALALVGPATGAREAWSAPRFQLVEAARHTGTLTVAPGRGLQARAVSRRGVSQLDARQAGSMQPGALGFHLLQADWEVKLAITELAPWITARVLHDVTLREGLVQTHVSIDYKVENAAVKRLRVKLPGLGKAEAATVRASGPALADFLRVGDPKDGTWDLVFRSRIAGATSVEIEFQRQRKSDGGAGAEEVMPLGLGQVRRSAYFVAVRPVGRLQVVPAKMPRGWALVDWTVAKTTLGQLGGRAVTGVPAMVLRVSEPDGPLALALERHDLADGVRMRVRNGELLSLLAPDGAALTTVSLDMEVGEKGTLRLRPPEGGEVFNVFVNDESAPLVIDKDGWWLFYVFPNPDDGQPTRVRFTYGTPPMRRLHLEGPALDVPLENLRWRVILPQGWELAGHSGDFDLVKTSRGGSWYGVDDYMASVKKKRSSSNEMAMQWLEKGNRLKQAGEQDKATLAFRKAAKARVLDEASNEDARVQLERLRTQQAMIGLNTRRQKVYFDNRYNDNSAPRNDQLEKAANNNPVLQQGAVNWQPSQADQLLEGNTSEENAALRSIAKRIVAQQLAAEPSPVALEVTIPEHGKIVTFGRAVQVDGARPLALNLKLDHKRGGGFFIGLLLALFAAVPAAVRRIRQVVRN